MRKTIQTLYTLGITEMGEMVDLSVDGDVEVNPYLAILTEVVTPERFREIANAACMAAMGGDAQARQWISDYLIGKPVECDGVPVAPEQKEE